MNNEQTAVVDLEDGGGQRNFLGMWAKVLLVLAVIWTFFQLYMSSYGVMDAIKFRAWHLLFLLLFSFLL